MIEAAVRDNKPDVAGPAVQHLSTITRASNTQWALGVEARSQALLERIENAMGKPVARETAEAGETGDVAEYEAEELEVE